MNFKMHDGDLVFNIDNHLETVDRIDSISQIAEYSIKTNIKEDYIDPHIGIKYLSENNDGEVGKTLSEIEVEQQIMETLKLIDFVEEVFLLEVSSDETHRHYSPKYILKLNDGREIERT